MKKICSSLRKCIKNIIDFEKKKCYQQQKKNWNHIKRQKDVTSVEKESLKKLSKIINYQKVKVCCHYTGKYRGAGHSICYFMKVQCGQLSPFSFS